MLSKSDYISLKVSSGKVSSQQVQRFKAVSKISSSMVELSVFLMFSRHSTSGLVVSGNTRVLASIPVREEKPAVKMDYQASAVTVKLHLAEVPTPLSPLQPPHQVSSGPILD